MPYKDVKPSDIFKCKQCGGCCKGYGGTFVTEKEIESIVEHLNTDAKSFVDNYCEMSGEKPVLAQGRDAYCVFWDGLCTIHQVKPRMCREWPFIKSVLVDINNWYIMAALCPGIRTDFPDSVIKECVRKELTKYL
jgi:Fe-S-cluster containining protein